MYFISLRRFSMAYPVFTPRLMGMFNSSYLPLHSHSHPLFQRDVHVNNIMLVGKNGIKLGKLEILAGSPLDFLSYDSFIADYKVLSTLQEVSAFPMVKSKQSAHILFGIPSLSLFIEL